MSPSSPASVEQRLIICLARWEDREGHLRIGLQLSKARRDLGAHLETPEASHNQPPYFSSSSLTSLGTGFQKGKRITTALTLLHLHTGFKLRGICPKPTTPLVLGVAPTDVEPGRKPASKGAERPRSPSSSPSHIPALLSPGSVCINYFHASDLFKGRRFTNFRDFDLKMQAAPLHAKAFASDCMSKINGSKGKQKKKRCSEQEDGSKVIFHPSFHSGSMLL